MAAASTLYLFAPDSDAGSDMLERTLADLKAGRTPTEEVRTLEDLRGKLEGGQIRVLLLDGQGLGQALLRASCEPDPEGLLSLSLADLEKRHILRVLASTNNNKTRAARILGIDTKTLYNKLKSYQMTESARRRREDTLRSAQAS
jgi:transcriptional regulator of acetoin/glycerol metabolism